MSVVQLFQGWASLVLGATVANEKSVWAGVKGQGMPEIKVRPPLGSEVSTDVDLGVFRRLDQSGPEFLRKLSSFCGRSGLSCVRASVPERG